METDKWSGLVLMALVTMFALVLIILILQNGQAKEACISEHMTWYSDKQWGFIAGECR